MNTAKNIDSAAGNIRLGKTLVVLFLVISAVSAVQATYAFPRPEASTQGDKFTTPGLAGAKASFDFLFRNSFEVDPPSLVTSVTLTVAEGVTGSASELVTFGLPLAPGQVASASELRVEQGGVELPIYAEPGLIWHWLDGTVRSVTIQLDGIDMRSGDVVLRITDAGRNRNLDLNERPHAEGWATAGSDKGNMPFPRVLALHDRGYLVDSGLIPPALASQGPSDPFEQLQSKQFEQWAEAMDYPSSDNSYWLFDRASAMFKAYMTTGDARFLKEGFLSKQFYFNYVRNDGTPPRPAGGDGCWTFDGTACADGKYIAPQQAKLAWALVGDNSQWDDSLIDEMALQADLGWNQYGTRDPYSSEAEGFTERAAGLVGLAEVMAYEITGNPTVLSHLQDRVESLESMQQVVQTWDTSNGWTPKSGSFTHHWGVHEGAYRESDAPTGNSADRRFSPWMSENIADFLWHAYQVTADAAIPEMLRQLGNAIDQYGFASTYVSGEGVNAVYTRKPGISGFNKCGGPDSLAVELMYSGSAYASNATLNSTHNSSGFTDTHNVEVVLPLALAYHFESSASNRTRLRARIEKIIEQWTETTVRDCSTIFDGVYRLWNWQHRSNSIRTWQWVDSPASGAGRTDILKQAAATQASSGSTSGGKAGMGRFAAEVADLSAGSGASGVEALGSSGVAALTTAAAPGSIAFQDVTTSVIDEAPQVTFHFWAGMPDVNGDGCFDLFIGSHSDQVSSAMYVQNRSGGACNGSFTHYENRNNYTQSSAVVPRITSRYLWGNWYAHPDGIWSVFGHDVDGSPAARYVVSDSVQPGQLPTYLPKSNGCHHARSECIPLDVTGDGNLELVMRSFSTTPFARRIVDIATGAVEFPEDPAHVNDFGRTYLVGDFTNNGFPEIVSTHAGGYFSYDRHAKTWTWRGGVFNNPILSNPQYTESNNHEVPLDYDNDGDLDIWAGRHFYDGDGEMAFVLLRNNGNGTFTDVSTSAGVNQLSIFNEDYWTTYGNTVVADLNLDGFADLVLSGETYGNSVTLIINNGNGTFSVNREIEFGTGHVDYSGKPWVNVRDYDNDGLIDLIKTSDSKGPNHSSIGLFRNTSVTSNHWLRVRVRGIGNNTDGLHTRIIVKKAGTEEIVSSQQVGTFGTAYQNLVPHFGVGSNQFVDVEIHYPHGRRGFRYNGLAVDQDIVVFPDGQIFTGYQPGTAVPMSELVHIGSFEGDGEPEW